MLLGQNGGRNQKAHLHPVRHGLECGAEGYLRLAVTYVAANQPVHGLALFHVQLYFFDGPGLVGCFQEREGVFQFPLPDGVLTELVALGRLPGRIELD